ncbi:hypothetical protein SAMN05519103_02719 [Rhizobiales bacterium GAS113]|nr:hypothetical protein SAMN05519103_02719 [Rhizobiales bacterium GAS113]
MNRNTYRRLGKIERAVSGKPDRPMISCLPLRPDGSLPTAEEEAAASARCWSMTPEEWKAEFYRSEAR